MQAIRSLFSRFVRSAETVPALTQTHQPVPLSAQALRQVAGGMPNVGNLSVPAPEVLPPAV